MVLISVLLSTFVSLCVTLLILRVRLMKRRSLESEEIVSSVRLETEQLISEMNGTTERNVLLLENRMEALRTLMDKTGKILSVLKQETNRMNSSEQVYSSLGKYKPMSLTVELSGEKQIGKKILSENHSQEEKEESKKLNFDSLSSRDKVLFLYRGGASMEEISSKIGIGKGEIELILSVYDKR